MYWNPEQYLQFEKERTQPAIDLANRIPQKAVDRVLDVGCGPGNSTKVLAERLPGARVLGIDRSLEMIEVAKEQHPALQFIQWDASQDLEGLGPSFDVIFFQCLHSVDSRSSSLVGAVYGQVKSWWNIGSTGSDEQSRADSSDYTGMYIQPTMEILFPGDARLFPAATGGVCGYTGRLDRPIYPVGDCILSPHALTPFHFGMVSWNRVAAIPTSFARP